MKIKCKHENTKGFETESFFMTSVEICLDCGMSRSVWEGGESEWVATELLEDAKYIKKSIDVFIDELSNVLLNNQKGMLQGM